MAGLHKDRDVSGLDTVLLARNGHLILLFQLSMDCIWDIKTGQEVVVLNYFKIPP